MQQEKPLVIIGAGGHGRVVLDIARKRDIAVRGFLDPGKPAGATVGDSAVLGSDALLDDAVFRTSHRFALAIGENAARMKAAAHLHAQGIAPETLLHPASIIGSRSRIGAGTIVCAGAIIGVDVQIGDCCIINTGAGVDHDCRLEDGVHLGPGVALAGHVHCEAGVLVGTGAAIIPGIRIGTWAVIGAGAAVVRDVTRESRVAGVPAAPLS